MTSYPEVTANLCGVSALYAWLRRHPRLVDGVLAVALAFAGLAIAVGMHRLLLVPTTLALTVPVVFRRTHPVGAFAVVIAVGALQVIFDIRPIPPDLTILVLLYTLAAYTTRRLSVIGLGICLLGSAAELDRLYAHVIIRTHQPNWLLMGATLFAGPLLIAWVLGDSMRYRRAYYANLEERAARLERDRDAQARMAATAERARIARELHDVVAHNVSVMVVQADGASYALGSDPDRTREALAAISATGRQALTEMRALLGVLRKSDEPCLEGPAGLPDAGGSGAPALVGVPDQAETVVTASLAPVPGIDQLDDLLDQARAAGLPVSCTIEGQPRRLAEGTALAAYRIIQESLTNTRKHAGPWAQASVLLRYTTDAIELVIADDGLGEAAASDGAGHGLTGMRERAAMYGGTVRAGPRPSGGFTVTARLPITPAQAGAA
jgi:signal transduction histidine kinase